MILQVVLEGYRKRFSKPSWAPPEERLARVQPEGMSGNSSDGLVMQVTFMPMLFCFERQIERQENSRFIPLVVRKRFLLPTAWTTLTNQQ